MSLLTLRCKYTIAEWITGESIGTGTNSMMIYNGAMSVDAAQARTWITTLLLYTRKMRSTFRIDCTLGTTIWWHTNIIL